MPIVHYSEKLIGTLSDRRATIAAFRSKHPLAFLFLVNGVDLLPIGQGTDEDVLFAERIECDENESTFPSVRRAAGLLCLLAVMLTSCSITVPVAATGNMRGAVTGTASAVTVCGITINGDASIAKAATSAGITRISSVDLRTLNVLGLYVRRTCIVNGYQDNVMPTPGRP